MSQRIELNATPDQSYAKLTNPSAGYGPVELMYATMALTKELGKECNITIPFVNGAANDLARAAVNDSLRLFDEFINAQRAPKRLHIPLGLYNHVISCVLDINAEGKATILIFDPLANDSYAGLYQLFIDKINEKFPVENIIKTTKRFQFLNEDDYQCGDWTLWFLKQASLMQEFPLEDIANYFDNLPEDEIPKRVRLREDHLALLQRSYGLSSNTASDARHFEQKKQEQPGQEFVSSLIMKIFENYRHSSFNIGNNQSNYNENTCTWEITLESKTEPKTVTKLKYNPTMKSLTFDTIDASNKDMVDAYVKGIIQLFESQGINKEDISIDPTLYSNEQLATAIKYSARRLGISISAPHQAACLSTNNSLSRVPHATHFKPKEQEQPGQEFISSLIMKIFENYRHSSFNIGNNQSNYNENTCTWEITLESKTEPKTVTKLKYNPTMKSLTFDTIDASNKDMVDAYVKGIIQLFESQGINKENIFIDPTLYPNKQLATAIKNSARRLGISTSPPNQLNRRNF